MPKRSSPLLPYQPISLGPRRRRCCPVASADPACLPPLLFAGWWVQRGPARPQGGALLGRPVYGADSLCRQARRACHGAFPSPSFWWRAAGQASGQAPAVALWLLMRSTQRVQGHSRTWPYTTDCPTWPCPAPQCPVLNSSLTGRLLTPSCSRAAAPPLQAGAPAS